jgi:hypothetical protein
VRGEDGLGNSAADGLACAGVVLPGARGMDAARPLRAVVPVREVPAPSRDVRIRLVVLAGRGCSEGARGSLMRLPGRSPSSIRVRALASVGIEIDDVGVLHFADREESPTRTQLEAVQRERARARALPDRLVRLVAEAPAAVARGFLSTPVSDLVREESEQGGMAGDHRRESRACLQDARLGASDGPSPARRSWPKREDASVSLGRFHSWRSDGDGDRRQ